MRWFLVMAIFATSACFDDGDVEGVGEACGGFAGVPCPDGLFCDYPDDSCGAADNIGTCQARPALCDDFEQMVCGCDGNVYFNACGAHSVGVDVYDGVCDQLQEHFACGDTFCSKDTEYCTRYVSDVAGFPDSYVCQPAPAACGGSVDCACLVDEPCADFGCEPIGQGFRITCPGG
jgi:hypothetical protein